MAAEIKLRGMLLMPDRGRTTCGMGICLGMCILLFGAGVLCCRADGKFINSGNIHISEICPSNKTAAYDDNGEYGADYVEIYNSGDESVDLTGYGLSDGLISDNWFVLDDCVIPAQTAIIVWNSPNIDDTTIYADDYFRRDIHGFSFGLARGETVVLTDSQNHILQTVEIPQDLPENKVYACSLQNMSLFSCSDASPYYVEAELREKTDNTLASPEFSVCGGWYSEALYVELRCEKGTIYYTLDGTTPDASSIRYDGKVYVGNRSEEENLYAAIDHISLTNQYLPESCVEKGTVIKAIAIDGAEASDISSQTYFVGITGAEYEDVSIMEITVDPEDFFDYTDGIYVIGNVYDRYREKFDEEQLNSVNPCYFYTYANYAKEGMGWERPAKIEFYSAEHSRLFEQRIGIRIHGGWSTSFNQKGFNLYARRIYDGNEQFLYDFFGDPVRKMMLRTGGFRDVYATKLRDVFNQSLVADRSIGIQKAEPCVVFLNGEYWGVYNLQEPIGTDYVSGHYGVEEDNVLLEKTGGETADGENTARYSDVIQYTESHDLSIQENYEYVEDRVDIQSFIDYYAFEIYIANVDAFANNFACWRTAEVTAKPYEDGKWRFLLYDTDDSTGIIPIASSYANDSFVTGHHYIDPLGERGDPLFTALLQNDEFRERFTVSFMDMVNQNFRYETVSEKLSLLAEQYKEPVVASQKRFRGDYSISEYQIIDTCSGEYSGEVFEADIAVIDEFYKNRAAYITEYLKEDLYLKGELYAVTVQASDAENSVTAINTIERIESGWSGSYYSDYPVSVSCCFEEGYRFRAWMDENGNCISTDSEVSVMLSRDMSLIAVIEPIT